MDLRFFKSGDAFALMIVVTIAVAGMAISEAFLATADTTLLFNAMSRP